MRQLNYSEVAANSIAAMAHLLIGAADRQDELNRHMAIMFGSGVPNAPTLLHWADWVSQGGRPILHIAFEDGQYAVPTLTLVCETEGQIRIFEHCHLWQRRNGGGAILIPDPFASGAYELDGDLKLIHRRRAPAGRAGAVDGMHRAYHLLAKISLEQIRSGRHYGSPRELVKRAA